MCLDMLFVTHGVVDQQRPTKKKIAISLLINERVIKRKRVASHVSHTNDTRCMRADVIRDVEERGSILEKGFEFWSLLASDFSLCQRNETFFPM